AHSHRLPRTPNTLALLSHYSHPTSFLFFFLHDARHPRHLHSFPTRRSSDLARAADGRTRVRFGTCRLARPRDTRPQAPESRSGKSEEHTSELQSPYDLVCRLLLEKKKKKQKQSKSHKTKPPRQHSYQTTLR